MASSPSATLERRSDNMRKYYDANLKSTELSSYRNDLARIADNMCDDLNALKLAFDEAKWNDPVAEATRQEVNEYIRNFNVLMRDLYGVMEAVAEMEDKCKKYTNSI